MPILGRILIHMNEFIAVSVFRSHLLRGAVPEDVSHSPTLVTGLGASIGAILHNVTNLEINIS